MPAPGHQRRTDLAESSANRQTRAVWIGWAVLVALVAIVAAVLSQAGSQSATRSAPPPRPLPSATDVRGFLPDAWYLPDDDHLGFVEIPAGAFVMGSDSAKDPLAFENERWSKTVAQGTVALDAFYIGRFEVTVAQYGAFVEATNRPTDAQTLRAPANHPVTAVTWPDALAYGRWLESTLKQSPRTPPLLQQRFRDGWHIALPSEAQWEKAARGNDGRVYPWGVEPRRDRANYAATATMPVGSFQCPECPYDVADMSGNVWEWTRSPYQPYPFDPSDDAKSLDQDALWVMRGGSFGDPERNVRAAIRGGADPGARRAFIGFRVALVRN
jgi:formylglycine-generating enzyme required for sulfatase activity